MTSVGEDFPVQQARVRDVLAQYEEVAKTPRGGGCAFIVIMIKASLARAERAAISGDLIAIIHSYKQLKDIE